ncbi:glycoside hydrolase family 1 protein [Alkalibaculum bacchi]|uniref:glycoside hydrolase family 1 protein n=1 Tax=Alkalibaculum bacchi TaxID=645887 RepID=UPI0026EBA26E|nr:glycoside hydrolase family 1 protein [Alkalibaculum bacchi]
MTANNTDLITLPFLWGSATAAYQCEGAWDTDGKGLGEWDFFNHKSLKNINHVDGDIACDFYHRYKEDLDLLAKGGQNTFRFSISWARIMPNGTGKVNKKGINFYNNLINYCIKLGIEPNVTLFHYDLPFALARRGGWLNSDITDWFCAYAKICFKAFGDRVRIWTTINEPHFYSYCSNIIGNYPPNRTLDFQSYFQWQYNLMLASAKAIEAFHELNMPGIIGVVHDGGSVEVAPETKHPDEVFKGADFFGNRMILCPALEGKLPPETNEMLAKMNILLYKSPEDNEIFKHGIADFLGLNLYCREYVTDWHGEQSHASVNNKGNGPKVESKCIAPLFETLYDKSVPHNQWGRELLPRVMYTSIMEIAKRYNNPLIFVTENGYGCFETPDKTGFVADDERIKVVKDFIDEMLRAKKAGAKVAGYYMWSAMDLYSWINGYKKRYGFIHINFDGNLKRTPKKSLTWYRQFIKSHENLKTDGIPASVLR